MFLIAINQAPFFSSGMIFVFEMNDFDYKSSHFQSVMKWVTCCKLTGIQTRQPASTGIFVAQLQIFYQLLQTVKNKTTVLILVFKEFLQASIRRLISIFYAKRGYHYFPLRNFCLSAEKFCRGTFLCFRKSLESKNNRDKRRGGYHDFLSKLFCLTVPKNFVWESFSVSLISGIEKC